MAVEVTLEDGTTATAAPHELWVTVKVRADILAQMTKSLEPKVISDDGVFQKVSWPIEIVDIKHEPVVTPWP